MLLHCRLEPVTGRFRVRRVIFEQRRAAYWFPFVAPYLCRPRSAFHSAFTTLQLLFFAKIFLIFLIFYKSFLILIYIINYLKLKQNYISLIVSKIIIMYSSNHYKNSVLDFIKNNLNLVKYKILSKFKIMFV